MTVDQALKVLAQVCSVYKGDLGEHQTLQGALEKIKEEISLKQKGESAVRLVEKKEVSDAAGPASN